jgi:biopolymer transport protein ExbD
MRAEPRLGRRRLARRRLGLAPLIDVIFLLLLFFMLSSTFTRYGEVRLTGGAAAPAAQGTEAALLMFDLGPEGLRLYGEPVAPAALAARLAPVLEGAEGLAVVAVEAGVPAQALVDVLAALEAIPGLAVRVVE